MAALLSVISTAIAFVDLAAFYAITRAVAFASVRNNPMHPVASAYSVYLLEQVGAVVFGLVWLIGIFILFHYYAEARTRPLLVRRFSAVTVVQLAIVAVSYVLPFILAFLRG